MFEQLLPTLFGALQGGATQSAATATAPSLPEQVAPTTSLDGGSILPQPTGLRPQSLGPRPDRSGFVPTSLFGAPLDFGGQQGDGQQGRPMRHPPNSALNGDKPQGSGMFNDTGLLQLLQSLWGNSNG